MPSPGTFTNNYLYYYRTRSKRSMDTCTIAGRRPAAHGTQPRPHRSCSAPRKKTPEPHLSTPQGHSLPQRITLKDISGLFRTHENQDQAKHWSDQAELWQGPFLYNKNTPKPPFQTRAWVRSSKDLELGLDVG